MTTALAIPENRAPVAVRGRIALQKTQGNVKRGLPDYLNQSEVDRLIDAAPNPRARLLMLAMWRAGLRVSEALALERGDLRFSDENPTIVVRRGKGGKSRMVPFHPELRTAYRYALDYGAVETRGRLIGVTRQAAWGWIKKAARAAGIDRRIGNHTLRHSYARHHLLNGVPLNYLSRWLGHAKTETTLIYLELAPDPTGSVESIP